MKKRTYCAKFDRRYALVAFAIIAILAFILPLFAAAAFADKPDKPDGNVKVGDRVIFFTDSDGDGFFERNVALVADDVSTVGRLNGTGVVFGNRVNLWVLPSEDATKGLPSRMPLFVPDVERGRSVNEYEVLATSNH